jgi:hypothetical protein
MAHTKLIAKTSFDKFNMDAPSLPDRSPIAPKWRHPRGDPNHNYDNSKRGAGFTTLVP